MTQKRFNLVMKALFDNFGNNIGVKVGDSFLETGVLFVSKFYRLTLVGSLWAVSKVESTARSRFAFRGLSCWEASVTLYLRFRLWA